MVMAPKVFITAVWLCFTGHVGDANTADGGYLTGHDLLKYCQSELGKDLGICLGYLEGVADTTSQWVGWGHLPKQICLKYNDRSFDIMEGYIAYALENPAQLENRAASSALNFLGTSYPCTWSDSEMKTQ
jgi:hypothetical protein